MSRLREMIKELCPDGVEYRKLGELGDFFSGLTGKAKEDFSEGNAYFIPYMNVYSNPEVKMTRLEYVNVTENEAQNLVQCGDVLFTGSSETRNESGLSSVLTIQPEEKVYLNSFCFGYRFVNPQMFLPAFTKHLFRSSEMRYQIVRAANGVTRFNISKKKMANVVIPVPPLPVQNEIVKLLDNFTELTAELTAELTLRKKQYSFYRDSLLNFSRDDVDVEWKTLGDVCDILSGYPFDSSQFVNNGIRLMRGMNVKRGVLDFQEGNNRYWKNTDGLDKYKLKADDIIIAMDGSLVGQSYGLVKKEHLPLLLVQRVARVRSKESNSHYVYHYISSGKLTEYVNAKRTAGAVPHISLKDIEKFEIPFPDIEKQNKIAEILDRFDALCNDLTQGLPAEIAARKKQYEYYRDKLLTFQRKGA